MIATLQSLRFVFVMLIFLSHFAYGNTHALDAGGDCGVAFFFLLSGFVLALGYGKEIADGSFRYGSFLWRRLRKFYPLHLLCLLFFLVGSRSPVDGRVVLNVLLLQSWVPDMSYYFSCNSVSWFLSSLLFCYLGFPLAYRHASRCGLVVVLGTYAVVCWLVPYEWVNALLYVNPMVRFVDFYIGLTMGKSFAAQNHSTPPTWIEPLLVILLLVALAVYPLVDGKLRNAPLYWLVLVPLIWVFAWQRGPVSRLLQSRFMLWLGSLSMPLFLTHQMLLGVLLRRLPPMPDVLMLAVCITVSLMVAWVIQIIFSRLFRL